MKKNVLIIVFAIILSWGLQSCNEDNDSKTAQVQLRLVDAPGDYLEVNVEIVDVQYNSSEDENGWRSFEQVVDYPLKVDLTRLIAGNELLLADEIIPAGMLKQIRLVINDNSTLVIEGEQEGETIMTSLDTPSAMQSGLKLKLDTELEAGFSYTFILDWDVQKSVVKAGDSDKYNLKPVIRVNTEVNSGVVLGTVVGEMEGDNVDGAVALNDVLVSLYDAEGMYAETLTDENGDFMFQGVDAGDYTVKINENNYTAYESSEVIKVVVGNISDVGTITLEVPVL